MIIEKHLTIVEAWNELKGIENQINLLETLRTTKKDIKAVNLKEILVSGGSVNNNAILNAINAVDEYSEKLHSLYVSRNAYEKYILDEINRLKFSSSSIVIGFLKEQQKMIWADIAKMMNYSEKQCRRYYEEYKGITPENNVYIKDDQK